MATTTNDPGSTPDVLIVGAGPVGLALACELAWRGLRLRVIDKADGPSIHSKPLASSPAHSSCSTGIQASSPR